MKKLAIAALAACLATSVSAEPEVLPMVVTASPSMTNWVETASRSLNSALARVDISRSETGITYVQFNCDESGKPKNIRTVRSQGYDSGLARVGRRTIGRIRSLHPMFAGARPNQLIEAAIIVADDQRQYDRLIAEASRHAREQNALWAARGLPNPVVSLAIAGGL